MNYISIAMSRTHPGRPNLRVTSALAAIAVAASLAPGAPASGGTAAATSSPNVLFILIDALRADRLGAWGYARPTSPSLDRLAASGTRFAEAQSQSSWTKASMASLWTGLYPVRTGILRYGDALPAAAKLPAETFRAHGYRTGGIWRNGWVAPNFGFAQGFDLYVNPRGPRVDQPEEQRPGSPARMVPTDFDVTRSARQFLDSYGRDKFFLYLHFMDVHQYIYEGKSALFGSSYSNAYDNAIHWVDRNVGELVEVLEKLGLRDRTLIIVAADHGEAFGEHGNEGHGRDLYREVTHVPLIFSLPGKVPAGRVVRAPVANIDIWPTVCALLALDCERDTDGRSLLPLLHEEPADAAATTAWTERPIFAQLDRAWGRDDAGPQPLVSLRYGTSSLHLVPGEGPGRLFDLVRDSGEDRSLTLERPRMAARLRAEIDAYMARPPAPWGPAQSVAIDALHLGQLRALGYLGGREGDGPPGRQP